MYTSTQANKELSDLQEKYNQLATEYQELETKYQALQEKIKVLAIKVNNKEPSYTPNSATRLSNEILSLAGFEIPTKGKKKTIIF